jgi:ATP-dependent exoDNAse (exonuclease V) alpha subunit
MLGLLQTARQYSTRIIFSGDTKQIQSVEASDALRILERESRLQSTSLTKVERQTNPMYRQAVEELRRNPARGFAKLEQIGAVQEVSLEQRAAAIVQAYRTASGQINRRGQRSSVLVVAPSHEEINRVTDAIRTDRQARGELTNGITTDRYVSLQFTHAQKTDSHNYRPGQVLVLHRATKNAAKHKAFEVLRVLDGRIVARSENSLEQEFTISQANSFDVFERRDIEIAPGDRLLLTANRKAHDFKATNGELVTVSGFDAQARIQVQDGRTLPANFKQFDYGYAVTAHRAQGKTVDAVVISADSMHKELFQVAATRARAHIQIVTGNQEALKKSIGISDQRQSVTELVARIQPLNGNRGSRRSRAVTAARQEALSSPAHTFSHELENYNHAQQNLGAMQQGIEYGIHS